MKDKTKPTIVCHSFPAWDAPYVKSTIELMTRMAKDQRVILVDYHYTCKDIFTSSYAPKKRILGLLSRWRNVETDHGVIEVYNSPPVLPTNWISNKTLFRLVSGLNGILLRRCVRKISKRIGHHNFTLVNAFNPLFGVLTRKAWKASKTFYYCYDEISGTDWAGKHGPKFEKIFAKHADAVICTSNHLQTEKSHLNPNCHLVHNGVNLDVFKAGTGERSKNATFGYVGAIDNRIDFELLKSIASSFPDHEISLYGPVKTEVPQLPQNVLIHGAIPQESLPEKIQGMDVCLIPFIKNELTKAIYPLKINEYLAMGKPVVCTDFADLSDFNKMVHIGSDTQSFLLALKKSLRYDSRLKAQKRMAFAKSNSWDCRAEQFLTIID